MFKIVCSKCNSDKGFIEYSEKDYVVLTCKNCQHQKEYQPKFNKVWGLQYKIK